LTWIVYGEIIGDLSMDYKSPLITMVK